MGPRDHSLDWGHDHLRIRWNKIFAAAAMGAVATITVAICCQFGQILDPIFMRFFRNYEMFYYSSIVQAVDKSLFFE